MLADQRNKLLRSDEKSNCVNKSEQSQDDKARKPVIVSALEKCSDKFVVGIHDAAENVQRSTPNVQHRMKEVPGGRVELPTKGL